MDATVPPPTAEVSLVELLIVMVVIIS